MKKIFFLIAISAITILSFFLYSSLFSPLMGSDTGVVVFMISDFHLPQDLYFWGQNRFGSLVPLIGQIFFKVFNFSPIISESITHYLLLIAGFFGFASLFKSNFTKIIFAVIWFLPPYRMLDLLSNTAGEQYCLIGISVFLINKIYAVKNKKTTYKQHFLFALTTITFICCIWVSDLAISTVFLLLVIPFIFFIKENKLPYLQLLKKTELYYILGGLITCTTFILYAKSTAVKPFESYSQFNLKTFIDSFVIFKNSIVDLFLFEATEPFSSLYCWLILTFLIYFIVNRNNIKYPPSNLKWVLIFVFDAFILFVIILSSKWAFNNGVPRRYFVCTYISLAIVFLLTLESLKEIKYLVYFKSALLLAVFIAGVGTIYNLKYYWPKTLTPKIKIVAEFEKLGNAGIIAEYFNSYVICSNPQLIKATPDDRYESTVNKRSYVRNIKLAHQVFKQDNIYIIKDDWLNDFPDKMNQFGHVLLKDGNPFHLGGCDVCKYKLLH